MNEYRAWWRRRRFLTAVVTCWLTLFFVSAAFAENGLYVRSGTLMRQGRPYRGIGANYQALFARLLINKDDTSSIANLALLSKAGIPFVRYRASGFYPQDQKLYLNDRAEFFKRMDTVVHAAEQDGIGLIPSLFWRLRTVCEVVGEPPSQLGNPQSKSIAFIRQFTTEMAERYKDSPAIWGWEFGNEGNMATDVPPDRAFTSDRLRNAQVVFARTLREIDPARMITSGNAMPRPAAWHNALGQFRQADNPQQFYQVMLSQNPSPMDTLSVHVYQRTQHLYPFGSERVTELLARLMRTSTTARKPLFLGEFPTRDRPQTEEFLNAIEANGVPLSAFWVFDYPPQESTMNVSFQNGRAFVLDLVAKANQALQRQ